MSSKNFYCTDSAGPWWHEAPFGWCDVDNTEPYKLRVSVPGATTMQALAKRWRSTVRAASIERQFHSFCAMCTAIDFMRRKEASRNQKINIFCTLDVQSSWSPRLYSGLNLRKAASALYNCTLHCSWLPRQNWAYIARASVLKPRGTQSPSCGHCRQAWGCSRIGP